MLLARDSFAQSSFYRVFEPDLIDRIIEASKVANAGNFSDS